jgi:hypothetical protein
MIGTLASMRVYMVQLILVKFRTFNPPLKCFKILAFREKGEFPGFLMHVLSWRWQLLIPFS